MHLGDREAGVDRVGDLGEEGVVAAGGLGAALDDVARGDGAGERVPVVGGPVERPGGRADDQRGVGDPAADDHVGAGAQRLGDAPAAEVGVGGDRLHARAGQRAAGGQVREVVAAGLEFGQPGEQVVALDVGDGRVQAAERGEFAEFAGQAGRVEAARVDHDLDAALQAGAEHVAHLGEEGDRVAAVRVAPPGLPQQQHGEFGEVVAGEDVDRAALDHLAGRGEPVAVVARAVRDPQGLPTAARRTARRCGHRTLPSLLFRVTGPHDHLAGVGAAQDPRGSGPPAAARRGPPGGPSAAGRRWFNHGMSRSPTTGAARPASTRHGPEPPTQARRRRRPGAAVRRRGPRRRGRGRPGGRHRAARRGVRPRPAPPLLLHPGPRRAGPDLRPPPHRQQAGLPLAVRHVRRRGGRRGRELRRGGAARGRGGAGGVRTAAAHPAVHVPVRAPRRPRHLVVGGLRGAVRPARWTRRPRRSPGTTSSPRRS